MDERDNTKLDTTGNTGWPGQGKIEFCNYQTKYREGLELVLKGVDLKVKALEKIGICGRTGAGKSSLTLALFRLIEATEGQILIDDVDISKLGLHDVRSKLSIIPQVRISFTRSIVRNQNVQYKNEFLDNRKYFLFLELYVKVSFHSLLSPVRVLFNSRLSLV